MKIIAELVKNKIIISGNIVEIYEYEKGYLKDFTINSKGNGGRVADYTSDNYEEHRKQALKRAKRDLRRLINSNVGMYGDITSKFMTLTFSENITDLKTANYEWEKFIKRLNYEVFNTKKSNLRYNVVIEFQKRGAIHYHAIFYNLPYIKQKRLLEIWGNSLILDIRKIEDIDNVGAYISEYLGDPEKEQGKEESDNRLKGKKSYFSSRGLFKPVEITDKKKVEALSQALPVEKKVFNAHFSNEHLGQISYTQYNLIK